MSERIRARAVVSGMVQGVGFRYTTRRAAGGHEVTGYVRNLPDGTVEIVAEGTRNETKAFLDDVRREMSSYIDSLDVVWTDATGEYSGFFVRY